MISPLNQISDLTCPDIGEGVLRYVKLLSLPTSKGISGLTLVEG